MSIKLFIYVILLQRTETLHGPHLLEPPSWQQISSLGFHCYVPGMCFKLEEVIEHVEYKSLSVTRMCGAVFRHGDQLTTIIRIIWGGVESNYVHSARLPPISLLYLPLVIMRIENLVE
jgi:hypothetical protein